jgi:hypothetical protein
MEGFVHFNKNINFAIHGEDRESGMNIQGGAVNDGG